MQLKQCLRLIKTTYKRFLSLFLIVLIGSALMVGLLSTPYIMKDSVDAYYRNSKIFDFQLYSNYGFSEDDLRALDALESIEETFASRFIDVYTKDEDEKVIRLEEIERNLNLFELIEGRYPTAENEALIIQTSEYFGSYALDDIINVYGDDDLSSSLKNTSFKIVGFVKAGNYMTHLKETSTLANRNLTTIVYIPAINFLNDYFTTIFLTVKDNNYSYFSDEYDDLIAKTKTEIDTLAVERKDLRRDAVLNEAETKIFDAEAELIENKEKAEKEIADAQNELIQAEKEIAENNKKLNAAYNDIQTAQKELDEAENELAAGDRKLKEAIKQIEENSSKSFTEVYTQTSEAAKQYENLLTQKEEVEQALALKDDLQNKLNEINALLTQIETLKNNEINLRDRLNILREEKANLPSGSDTGTIDAEIAQIETSLALIENENNLIAQKNTLLTKINGIKQSTDGVLERLNSIITTIEATFNGSPLTQLAALQQIKDSQDALILGSNEVSINRKKLAEAIAEYEDGQKQLAEGQKEYEEGLLKLEDAKEELAKKIAEAENDIKDAKNELADLKEGNWTILDHSLNYHTVFYQNTVEQMRAIAEVIPLLFFLVAALVCLTTMTRLLDEERQELGTLSALGFTHFEIIFKYVIYAFLAAFSGALVGIVVGMAIFPGVIYHEWRLMYDLPTMQMHLYLFPCLIGILSFSILMVLVTAYVAYKALDQYPGMLMRPKAPKNIKAILLEKIKPIWQNLSFSSKITIRNIVRYKSRFFMTVIGVAGCTGLLVLGFGIKDSIKSVVASQYGQIFLFDHSLVLKDDYDFKHEEELLRDIKHCYVTNYSAKTYKNSEENDETINIFVFDKNEIKDFINLNDAYSGQALSLEDGVYINEKYALNHNLKTGDMIGIEDIDGDIAEVEIKGIVEMYFEHYLFMNEETYRQIFKKELKKNNICLFVEDKDIINLLQSDRNTQSLSDFSNYIDNFENMIEALDIIILVIVIAAGSLAFVVLINLIQVNISERKREIATLKVLGFTAKEVRQYLYKEIILLSFIGAIFGLPLGKIEHHFVMNVINMKQIMFGKHIYSSSYLGSFGITICFTLIVLALTNKSLRDIAMVESLKSIE